MVHRLLAALIGVDQIHPNMLDRRKLIRQTENMNRRHRRAQYASRASVLLNTFMMVKENPEPCLSAIVIGIRSNGIQVMIPKFGLESIIYLNDDTGTWTRGLLFMLVDFYFFMIFLKLFFFGTPQLTARPTYRRGITFKDIESGNYSYGSMCLDELNRTVPGRPGFENFKQSYSSAVGWARGKLACSRFFK
uniref:Exosome complex exonuclease RRP44 S1 domain-containing protein n=1 Tax=Meloidogyne enterolobii TaxID=390850 RepID=A0A6V7XSM4_MELEN|nr:unnamed protein product [Meloidogyne enterolobii]